MSALILDGREVAKMLLAEIQPRIRALDPKLVVVQVGDDAGSASYIAQKMKSSEAIGMRHAHIHLVGDTSRADLFHLIHELNDDEDVTGFIVQLPLPEHLRKDVDAVIETIDPLKDVDGFGPANLGNVLLSKDRERLPPATPSGIIEMLRHYAIPVEGKHAVIVGKSNIVGKPMALMLLNRGATVSVCHSKTADLGAMTRQADILIVAAGKPGLITKDMVKPGVVVIDVGMNRVNGKLCGDTDFEALKEIASAITPVPGGVGPLTVASLIRNCVHAKERQIALS